MIKRLIVGSMQTNCYVLYNENKECILIDPGSQGQKISKYIEENEYEICGSIREKYIDGVWNKDREEDWLSEIQIPVRKKISNYVR